MNELEIDQLSVFGMPPDEMARLAADIGCETISLVLQPAGRYNPHGYLDWSLRNDAGLRRELRAVLPDSGVLAARMLLGRCRDLVS